MSQPGARQLSTPTRRRDSAKVISARIRELEARLALYESPASQGEPGRFEIRPSSARTVDPQQATSTPLSDAEYSAQRINTERDIGSSQDFGNRVQTLFEQRSVQSPEFLRTPRKSMRESLFPEKRPAIKGKQISATGHYSLPNLPREQEAYQLLDSVLFYFGEMQYLFDARDVSDQLATFYANLQENFQNPTIGFLQALVIFALGRLVRGESDVPDSFPGYAMFNYALDLLPNPSELRAHGVAGIEILVIITFYLQNIDRKDDSASYIGLAIRLAMLHNLHRKESLQSLRRSEATHASRLWWTVHMQDKRRFFSPLISPEVIYSNESCPKDEFVAGVKDIISSLNQLAKQISQGPGSGSSLFNQQSSKKDLRLSISLYTILYQSIILTLRPIVLHLTKSILGGETTFSESGSAFQQLTCTCIEAARRSLELMIVAQKEDMIAKFGFFDLDTIFSAGFIMLLAAIIESTNNTEGRQLAFLKPSPGISESLKLLDFLAGYHNQAAKARRDQIQRLYEHIPALLESLRAGRTSGDRNIPSPLGSCNGQSAPTPRSTGGSELNQSQPPHSNLWDFDSGGNLLDGYASGSLPMQFPTDPHTMYSLYPGDDFVLTGGDLADFEELQRHLLGPDSVI
ncbi:uncharacterized protein N7482_009108 [Penicillium canariense]|uniref:Xylanolytic transcriptional activator regulatory domain-containing protein n=1 Tax=Penicillium canariense TaxID=189055 RepID=A0A9W9LFZ3_9EURO|nr:uncharacterized protein N7482_009108 [Penicillium canariense]KAJ5152630.1 hypothetical protein N7482_009108 [Penicillium canariense]